MKINRQEGERAVINGHSYIYSNDKNTYMKARDYEKHQAFKKREKLKNDRLSKKYAWGAHTMRDLDMQIRMDTYRRYMDQIGVAFVEPATMSQPDLDYSEVEIRSNWSDTPIQSRPMTPAESFPVSETPVFVAEARQVEEGVNVTTISADGDRAYFNTDTGSPFNRASERVLSMSQSMRDAYARWRQETEQRFFF